MKSLNEYVIKNNLEENNLKEVAFDISLLDKENYWEHIL